MQTRGFQTNKSINLEEYSIQNKKDWNSQKNDLDIIKKRITEKLNKKLEFYRCYGEYRSTDFFIKLLK